MTTKGNKKKSVPIQFRFDCALTEKDRVMALDFYNNTPLPYLEQLALLLDVDEDTITNWSKVDKTFGTICKKIKIKQKIALLQKAPDKDYATNGVLFLLRVNHKMIDTTAVDLGNKEDKPFKMNIDNFDDMPNEEIQRTLTSASQEHSESD